MDEINAYEELKKVGVDPNHAVVMVKSIANATDSITLGLVTKLQLGASLIAAGSIIVAVVWFIVGIQIESKTGALHNKIDKVDNKIERVINILKKP